MNHDLFTKYGMFLKIVGVLFVGIHIPLVLAGLSWLRAPQPEPQALMLSVLLGTVAGLALSTAGIWSVLRARGVIPG